MHQLLILECSAAFETCARTHKSEKTRGHEHKSACRCGR